MNPSVLSRRSALRMAAGLVGGSAALALVAPAAQAAGQFQDVRQFKGAWLGSYDGRSARLTISVVGGGPGLHHVGFEYVDLDRGLRYTASRDGVPSNTRQFTNLLLNGPDQILWPRLDLQTWNTDHISGVSTWSNAEYGFSFAREGVAEPYITPPRRFSGMADVLGAWNSYGPINTGLPNTQNYARYEGHLDGRRAEFRTYVSPHHGPNSSQPRVYFELLDWDRSVGWYTWVHVEGDRDWRAPIASGLDMEPFNWQTGGRLRLRSLNWHTWNCWYVSGETWWNNQSYGMSFTRRTPFG